MTGAVLWCDGRRSVNLPPGARVEVRRGERPVLLARLRRDEPSSGVVGAGAPFTDRLVAKFGLPVTGWRGRQAARNPGLATDGRTVAEEARLGRDGSAAGPPAAPAGEEVSQGDA
jgi:NAD+ kinase